jgi:hypothetical protein
MDGTFLKFFYSDMDVELGKITKKRRANPTGQDVYLRPDGTVERDEDKIIAAQRIFKHEYYKPGGPAFQKGLARFESCVQEGTGPK